MTSTSWWYLYSVTSVLQTQTLNRLLWRNVLITMTFQSQKKKPRSLLVVGLFFAVWLFVLDGKKKKRKSSPGGLEPPTFRLTAERANRLRHGDRLENNGNKKVYKPFVLATLASMKHNSQFFARFRFNVSCLNGSKSLELTLQLRMSNQSN